MAPRYATTVPLFPSDVLAFVAISSAVSAVLAAAVLAAEGEPAWFVAFVLLAVLGPVPLLRWPRLDVRVDDAGLHYRIRPFHRRERTIPARELGRVTRHAERPDRDERARTLDLGTDRVAWRDGLVRFVLADAGVVVETSDGRTVGLWVPESDALARALDDATA
jgi:hypothetical protein